MSFGIRIEFIENLFERFLELNTKLKFIVTYVMCWVGFLFSLSIGKLISNILYEPVEVVSEVGTAKFHVVSSVVSSKMGVSYYSIVLSYFINNASACLIIVSAFVLVSHLYKKEISKDLSNFKEYLRTLLLFYLIVVINPITGFVGVNIPLSDIVAIVPHGVFEFAGFALAIVLGIESANYILPIINQENRKSKFILIAMLLLSLTFIGVAAFIEPFDWLIYSYAKNNGISVLEAMIMAYGNLISYFLGI